MKKIGIRRDRGIIDIEEINKFEKKIGYIFPVAYKSFISQHNAAYLDHDSFEFYNTYLEQDDSRDISFYGYGKINVKSVELIDDAQDFDIYVPDSIISIGRSANGDYICFDYRENPNTDNPLIVVMYHDAYDDDQKMYVDFVAKDFETFMDSLYEVDGNGNRSYPVN